MKCKVCNSGDLVKLNTYKHYWYKCNSCNCVERSKKNKYFFDGILPGFVKKRLPTYFNYLLSDEYFDPAKITLNYDYYAKLGDLNVVSKSKWNGEANIVHNRIMSYNIDIKGKDLLDISGGPGFVAESFKEFANYVLLTEYSAKAVEGMQRFLSVDVKKYDYNSDDITAVTSRKFDIIFIRFSINFCFDLNKFCADIKKIIKPGGVVYIEHVEPNKGCILRWQFDGYTYNILYDVGEFAKIFERNGFLKERQEVLFTESYNKPYWIYPNAKVKLFYAFVRVVRDFYRLRIGNRINSNLEQVSWVSIFRA